MLPAPKSLTVTLKLSFINAWKGDLVQGVKVVVQTDRRSYLLPLKTQREEKDSAAIQSPLNTGPFQYLEERTWAAWSQAAKRLLSLPGRYQAALIQSQLFISSFR